MRTIKISVLLALSMLFVTSSFGKVRIGPSVGFNYSSLVQSGVDNDFKFGLKAGVTFDLGIAKFFSVVPEVNFSQMGWKYLGEGEHKGQSETATLNYIQVPLNLVFKLKLGGNTRFLLFLGGYGAYAVSGNIKMDYGEGNTEKSKAPLGTNQGQINPLDIGLDAGLGFQVNKVSFKLQYNAGINSLNNTKTDAMLNCGFAMSLGFFFN